MSDSRPPANGDSMIGRISAGDIPPRWRFWLAVFKEVGFPVLVTAALLWAMNTTVSKLSDNVTNLGHKVEKLIERMPR